MTVSHIVFLLYILLLWKGNREGEVWLWLALVGFFCFSLHNTANVIRVQRNMNASSCGTHWWTGGRCSIVPPHLTPTSVISILRWGRWLLYWRMVCTIVELKDWIKWPDPTLPGGSTLQRREIIDSILVLQRTPLWHSTMHKPFSNTFPRCKTGLAPWDFCNGGKKI